MTAETAMPRALPIRLLGCSAIVLAAVLLGPVYAAAAEPGQRARPIRKVYPLGELITRDDAHRAQECRDLAEIVGRIPEKSSGMVSQEKPPTKIEVKRTGNRAELIVTHNRRFQEDVARLLDRLRRIAKNRGTGKNDPKTAPIDEALARRVSFDFSEEPLVGVLASIRRDYKLPIEQDVRALFDEGIRGGHTITLRVSNVSLRSALRVMGRQQGLGYRIEGGNLLLTTREQPESNLSLRLYPAGNLVSPVALRDEKKKRLEFLSELMTAVVEPDSWDTIQGPGECVGVALEKVSFLAILQTDEVHRQVADLLAMLRRAVRDADAGKPAPWYGAWSETPAAKRLHKAMAKTVSLDFDRHPFREVIAQIRTSHGLEIQTDLKALAKEKIDTTRPVTVHVKDIPLRSALGILLKDFGLAYTIRDEVVWITTPEVADEAMLLRVYPVEEMVLCRDENDELWDDYLGLTEMLEVTVFATTWESLGGEGVARGITLGNARLLVVRQSEEGHREIAGLLAKLRAVAKKNPRDGKPPRRSRPSKPGEHAAPPQGGKGEGLF